MTVRSGSLEPESQPVGPDQSPEKAPPQSPHMQREKSPGSTRKRRPLARLVSQDALSSGNSCPDATRLDLSKDILESDATSKASPNSEDVKASSSRTLPVELLGDRAIMKMHTVAIRLEADIFPMRLILSRLMANPIHNRKGLFNKPVDPVALGLFDYHLIVTQPMDLGTIKKRLHAIAYQSRQEVADDVRLVFRNAMRYNPLHNIVHKCASELLASFEDSYHALDPCVSVITSNEDGSKNIEALPWPESGATVDASRPHDSSPAGNTKPGHAAGAIENHVVAPSVNMQALGSKAPLCVSPKRKSRLPSFVPHSCEACHGRKCGMCKQGCLLHEPSLLVCSGNNCGGSKIRKGAQYYISKDGNRQFCHKCFASLPPVLPNASDNDTFRYKQELLKRKNDEEIAEAWIECTKCATGVHAVCAMHSDYLGSSEGVVCSDCRFSDDESSQSAPFDTQASGESYTFLSGLDHPVSTASVGIGSSELSAFSFPKCPLSSFIEMKVQERMKAVPNADTTIAVRVISDSSRHFDVPDVVRRHFRMDSGGDSVVQPPPKKVHYKQKAIMLFQKIDGLDVCIFCMYVQEYDGKDQYDSEFPEAVNARHSKRVYIAYIDSVEHFRPRECRTQVYHEILVSYLASARARGFDKAQIWACPPSRGNNFVFWNHPASQRTPTQDRLDAWYHGAISRGVDCGIITDVKSLFESDFEKPLQRLDKESTDSVAPSGRMLCPPLLEGDFWIEEATRVHQANISRNIKVRAPTEVCVWNVAPISGDQLDPCPALQVATLLKDRIMTHPSSVPFRRPVNAAALRLINYHKIIEKPMDLGTVYSLCVLGEYQTLRELVNGVELMVANAKKFNPVGHFVHKQAIEIHYLFFQELNRLTKLWAHGSDTDRGSWEAFAHMSMSLDMNMDITFNQTEVPTASVVIEDDRSSDGSRTLGSSVSTPCSPGPAESAGNQEPIRSASMQRSMKIVNPSPIPRSGKVKPKKLPRQLDLLSDGPDAVLQSMVGGDTWLLDKKNPAPPKSQSSSKKSTAKRRRSSISSSVSSESTIEAPVTKKRRQSWLGEEVGDSVRKMRTSFFSCSLSPKGDMSVREKAKLEIFRDYVRCFEFSVSRPTISSPIADARYALLEFSQFRHLEFDTLRRAKYSSAVLLYHLHNADAPGTVPMCTTCSQDIEEVRWHKVKKIPEKRRVTKGVGYKKAKAPVESSFGAEELCRTCHGHHANQDEFIPIPVSLKRHL
jgi:hypothetical protein